MMKLSIVTNSISHVAESAAIHIKNLCINSKVDALFRVTVKTAGAHPCVTIGLGLVAIYCCRGQIEGLITRVNNATQSLYQTLRNSITNVTSIFRRNSIPSETGLSRNGEDSQETNVSLTRRISLTEPTESGS